MTEAAPPPVRVAIIEDSPIVREMLGEQIAAMAGLELAGTADSISAAAAVIAGGGRCLPARSRPA